MFIEKLSNEEIQKLVEKICSAFTKEGYNKIICPEAELCDNGIVVTWGTDIFNRGCITISDFKMDYYFGDEILQPSLQSKMLVNKLVFNFLKNRFENYKDVYCKKNKPNLKNYYDIAREEYQHDSEEDEDCYDQDLSRQKASLKEYLQLARDDYHEDLQEFEKKIKYFLSNEEYPDFELTVCSVME